MRTLKTLAPALLALSLLALPAWGDSAGRFAAILRQDFARLFVEQSDALGITTSGTYSGGGGVPITEGVAQIGDADETADTLNVYHSEAGARPAPILLARVWCDFSGTHTITGSSTSVVNVLQSDESTGSGLTVTSNRVTVASGFSGVLKASFYATTGAGTTGSGGNRSAGVTHFNSSDAVLRQAFQSWTPTNSNDYAYAALDASTASAGDYVAVRTTSIGELVESALGTNCLLIVELWSD